MPQYLNTFSEIDTIGKISDRNPIKFDITSNHFWMTRIFESYASKYLFLQKEIESTISFYLCGNAIENSSYLHVRVAQTAAFWKTKVVA